MTSVASSNKQQAWKDYFDLLGKLGNALEELAIIEESKIHAITKGDLPTIDEIMKKEQAFSMTIRGFEQKRVKMLAVLEVPPGPLSDLHTHMPSEVRVAGKRVVEQVKKKYERYQIASDLARKNLEMALGQLESITGVPSGYEKPAAKPERQVGEEPRGGGKKAYSKDLSMRARGVGMAQTTVAKEKPSRLTKALEKNTIGTSMEKSPESDSGGIGAGCDPRETGGTSSRLSQFVRKKTAEVTQGSATGGGNTEARVSTMAQTSAVEVKAKNTAVLPPNSVMDALRQSRGKPQECQGTQGAKAVATKPVMTRGSSVNLRQEMLKKEEKPSVSTTNYKA